MICQKIILQNPPNHINNINCAAARLGAGGCVIQSESMETKKYSLADEFINEEAERGVLAAVAQSPNLFWEIHEYLPTEAFAAHSGVWQQVVGLIETENPLPVPTEWIPAVDPLAEAKELAALLQRRMLCSAQEVFARDLRDKSISAIDLASSLEEAAAKVQVAIRETSAGQLIWAQDLLPEILQEAANSYKTKVETGKSLMGIPTGLARLDGLLNGLNEGLLILAGPPSVGKTTLAWQIAEHATREAPVLYVTFENSPKNLLLKSLCARAGCKASQVQNGFITRETLEGAVGDWRHVISRIAVIEGNSQLSVPYLRAKAQQAMKRHGTKRCLVVVDYIQLWAKCAETLRHYSSVRERVEVLGTQLRELATRLSSPVLALASQNRAQGNYGAGGGTAALDSLKESGDLEYAADAVMFLTETTEGGGRMPGVRLMKLDLKKNRYGEQGGFSLVFLPDVGSMREEAEKYAF